MTQHCEPAAVSVAAAAYTGVDAHLVEIRATIEAGWPQLTITSTCTGIPEARDRVRAAIINAGLPWPDAAVRVDIVAAADTSAPATGTVDSGLDAGIAVAVLAAARQIPIDSLARTVLVAELGLDGALRVPTGVRVRVAAAAAAGFRHVVLPTAVPATDAVPARITPWPVHHLRQLVDQLRALADGAADRWPTPGVPAGDLADLPAAWMGRRVLEIAAAGGHHVALVGGPETGKTMLAERLPGLLPDLDERTGGQVADLYQRAGLVPPAVRALRRPPWQAPHHTAGIPAHVGTARRPGAVSLAHAGVLFLDEAAEFARLAVDSLRQPIDTGRVVLIYGSTRVEYPAQAQLVIASPECPCPDPASCTCTLARRRGYRRHLTILLDRIEIRLHMPPMPDGDSPAGEPTAVVATRVAAARAAAVARWNTQQVTCNHDVPTEAIQRSLTRNHRTSLRPLHAQLEAGAISARGAAHVLRLAWTIADLAGHTRPTGDDVAEAIGLHTGR
ncbi:MAG: magnesium chelatase family protein [Actinoplanes sp.]|nr:magnesium chelatase family protein [Actinoplanes sp.]